ncbi:hypothetical protein E2C01_050234 [Portunus trituberculatus]|uniref:Uncharacterized protein n=1 Tax=Portunus trituberculatus TaxID=210409 RepID=A0A5B7G8F8_PORTR|nr:hypothetical protein [Portunus trituberculatus]
MFSTPSLLVTVIPCSLKRFLEHVANGDENTVQANISTGRLTSKPGRQRTEGATAESPAGTQHARHQAPDTDDRAPGTRRQASDNRDYEPRTGYQAPGIRNQAPEMHQASSTRRQASGTRHREPVTRH